MSISTAWRPPFVVIWLSAVLALAHASTSMTRTPRRYLPVPAQAFEEVEPYVRANIVPFVRDGDLELLVCEGAQDRSTIEPFDERRAAFTKVLLLQAMHEDQSLYDAIHVATAAFRADATAWKGREPSVLRTSYWEQLAQAPDIYPKLRRRFQKALRRGQLRCWICERDLSFAPDGLKELEERGR